MSLIFCPKCGKQISDTTHNCVHCGYALNKESESAKDYTTLPLTERDALLQEFETAYPQCANKQEKEKYMRNKKIMKPIGYIILSTLAASLIINLLDLDLGPESGIFFILIGISSLLSLVCIPVGLIFSAQARRYRNRYLKKLKVFQTWLKRDKNLDYKVTFSKAEATEKNYFENLDINFDVEKVLYTKGEIK